MAGLAEEGRQKDTAESHLSRVGRVMQLTGAEAKDVLARGVRVMSDLVRHTVSSAIWKILENLLWLRPKLPPSPPAIATIIQRGLSWRCSVTVAPLKPDDMVEVLGWVRNGPI